MVTEYGCGRDDYKAHEGRWETTNRHFYVDLPAEKRMAKPEYYSAAADTIQSALAHEAAEDSKTANANVVPSGRAGARGAPQWF